MIILGVLNGESLKPGAMRTISHRCDRVWAADGGLKWLIEENISADGIVGDLDSIPGSLDSFGGKVVNNPDQNSSDVEKLLAQVVEEGATGVVLTCAHGGRVDHVLTSMMAALTTQVEVIILYPQEWCFCVPGAGNWVFGFREGQRISVMPCGPLRLSLSGVKWPLDHAVLHAPGQTSISNVAISTSVRVEVFAGQGWVFGGYDEMEVPEWFRSRHLTTAL